MGSSFLFLKWSWSSFCNSWRSLKKCYLFIYSFIFTRNFPSMPWYIWIVTIFRHFLFFNIISSLVAVTSQRLFLFHMTVSCSQHFCLRPCCSYRSEVVLSTTETSVPCVCALPAQHFDHQYMSRFCDCISWTFLGPIKQFGLSHKGSCCTSPLAFDN